MFRIFVSYRRGDRPDATFRLYEDLARRFGRRNVFCDVKNIPIGDNYRDFLDQAAQSCDVMAVVVGPDWVGRNADGTRRIDDPNDWVHREAAIALSRGIPVVPVVVPPGRSPSADDLPEPLRELAYRQGVVLQLDKLYDASIRELVAELESCRERRVGAVLRAAVRTRRVLRGLSNPSAISAIAACAAIACFGTWWAFTASHAGTPKVNPAVVGVWEDADRTKLAKEVEAILARRSAPRLEHPPDAARESSLGSPDYSPFNILSDDRSWDLRSWRDVTSSGGSGGPSIALMYRVIRVVKIGDAREIRFEARTDGGEVYLGSSSHRGRSRVHVQTQDGFVGGRATKVRQIAVDVSDVPVGEEFTVRVEGVYVDSLQDPEDRWVGATGYQRSDRIRLTIVMPEGRPLIEHELQVEPATRERRRPYQGPRRLIVAEDRKSLLWEVPSPAAGNVYAISMRW